VFTSFVSFNISVSGSELTISGTGVTDNSGTFQTFVAGDAGQIIFNNASTAGDATIIGGDLNPGTISGKIIFNDSSTAGSAILIARGGDYGADSGNILFNGASTGGTARVEVFSGITSNTLPGFLDIRGHQSGVTIGSIEGNGFIYLGANNLTVGTNDIDTTFYGVIANFGQGGSLCKATTASRTPSDYIS